MFVNSVLSEAFTRLVLENQNLKDELYCARVTMADLFEIIKANHQKIKELEKKE